MMKIRKIAINIAKSLGIQKRYRKRNIKSKRNKKKETNNLLVYLVLVLIALACGAGFLYIAYEVILIVSEKVGINAFVLVLCILLVCMLVKLYSYLTRTSKLVKVLSSCKVTLPPFEVVSIKMKDDEDSFMGKGSDRWDEYYEIKFKKEGDCHSITKGWLYQDYMTYIEQKPASIYINPHPEANTASITVSYHILQ